VVRLYGKHTSKTRCNPYPFALYEFLQRFCRNLQPWANHIHFAHTLFENTPLAAVDDEIRPRFYQEIASLQFVKEHEQKAKTSDMETLCNVVTNLYAEGIFCILVEIAICN
jgi:hypothetical protein